MHGNIFLDANTFDYITHENDLLGQLFALHEANKINIVISGRVRDETIHPNTPREVRELAEVQIFTLPVQLIGAERSRLNEIKRLMGGNAQSGKHDADAQHIFDASKNGGRYLITHDKRILAKRLELESLLTPFRVVTLDEFSAALKEFGLLQSSGEMMAATRKRIQDSIDDPRPSVPLEEAFDQLRARNSASKIQKAGD